MKKSMLIAGLSQFVVALVLAAPAVAQQQPYIIHVPFRFHVNAQVLSAGKYRVKMAAGGTVQVYGIDHVADAAFVALRLSRSARGFQGAEFVFHRYGNQYFLSQVWFPEVDPGYELEISNAEREVAQKIPKTEMVLRAGD